MFNKSNDAREPANLPVVALAAWLVGVLSGLVAALFRLTLQRADLCRNQLVAWSHTHAVPGFAVVVALVATLAGVAAWIVRRFAPHAGGSGIPHVEAVLNGHLPPAPFWLLPVKFVGGVLAIGGGLALGREGPSVQMGASLGALLGRVFQFNAQDVRAVLAAGAGAGLATAFNAPLAGGLFVLEELMRRFDPRAAITALAASAGAITVARVLFGSAPDFTVPALAGPGFGGTWIFIVLGVVVGAAGAGYTRTILGVLHLADLVRGWSVTARAAVIGAGVGAVAWFAPGWVGGGDVLTQATLSGAVALSVLPWLCLFRFFFGAVSYAAGTPGGIFAPILVVGAQLGWLFAQALPHALQFNMPPAAFAVVGMAAFFTAVVRAPLTGIMLVTELTGNVSLLLPMLGASAAAMVVPPLLRTGPIYDALLERTLALDRIGKSDEAKTVIYGSRTTR
jgi:CIC family chloride channel protein